MPEHPGETGQILLTRRSFLVKTFAMTGGLVLAGCGGGAIDPNANSGREVDGRSTAALDGVLVDVWRDPG